MTAMYLALAVTVTATDLLEWDIPSTPFLKIMTTFVVGLRQLTQLTLCLGREVEVRSHLPFVVFDLQFVKLKQSAKSPITSFVFGESANAIESHCSIDLVVRDTCVVVILGSYNGLTFGADELPPFEVFTEPAFTFRKEVCEFDLFHGFSS